MDMKGKMSEKQNKRELKRRKEREGVRLKCSMHPYVENEVMQYVYRFYMDSAAAHAYLCANK